MENSPPERKKQKVENSTSDDSNNDYNLAGLVECIQLLNASIICSNSTTGIKNQQFFHLPDTIDSKNSAKIKNDMKRLKRMFDLHGFRTSIVASPRQALSVYKDSCVFDKSCDSSVENGSYQKGKLYLLSMLGCHPEQSHLEKWYSSHIRDIYCLLCFCHRMQEACSKSFQNATFGNKLISIYEGVQTKCNNIITSPKDDQLIQLQTFLSSTSETISQIKSILLQSDPRIRLAQLDKEYERIYTNNSTYANAHVQQFLTHHSSVIKDIYFKPSHIPKYERITIYLYDPQIDLLKPPPFTFLPSLPTALLPENGVSSLVNQMMESFWNHVLRQGYFATEELKQNISPQLKAFFRSGIVDRDGLVPFQLNAHFTPKYPLSFYIYGKAGAGKSSFVQNFAPALHSVLEEYVDAALLVRFVKQNLNKPFADLQLEFELRPNNNDLSIMSIIQGRRMTLTQTKPGLVLVGMEEMAAGSEYIKRFLSKNDDKGPINVEIDPHQYQIAQLLSQRFAGRLGDFQQEEKKAPRNSGKRGISGDASLITLFTSNYPLESPSMEALQRLDMFKNLKCIEVKAVDNKDRLDFAKSYLVQCIRDQCQDPEKKLSLKLAIPLGKGDIRPLVRELRMLSFFVSQYAKLNGMQAGADSDSCIDVAITQDSNEIRTIVCNGQTRIPLRLGSFRNLYPVRKEKYQDARVESLMTTLKKANITLNNPSELAQVMDYYFAKILAPAVIVSKNAQLINAIVEAISKLKDVHSIKMIDPNSYKIMKSLYDPSDTPNLRDDILQFGKGSLVSVGLQCTTMDAQMAVREIIEDTPSMTAFSTSKSALYKSGLFFSIFVDGKITPEIQSRASIIL